MKKERTDVEWTERRTYGGEIDEKTAGGRHAPGPRNGKKKIPGNVNLGRGADRRDEGGKKRRLVKEKKREREMERERERDRARDVCLLSWLERFNQVHIGAVNHKGPPLVCGSRRTS